MAEFIDKFRSEYDEYVEEYRGDSGFYGPLVPWCELGFPPLPQLADQEPELLARLIAEFFREDAIDVLLPEPSVGEWSPYTLNSVDRAEVAAGIVAIEGVAYDAPRRDAGEPEPA